MRKWLKATWEWWRQDCAPVSMLAIVLAIGFGAYRIGEDSATLTSMRWSLWEIEREVARIPSEVAGIDSALYSVSSDLVGITRTLRETLRLQCAENG